MKVDYLETGHSSHENLSLSQVIIYVYIISQNNQYAVYLHYD